MIGIVDYGMGNLKSVYHAVEMSGYDALLCTVPGDIEGVEKIILPGVGAFGDCMDNLRQRKFIGALEFAVFDQKKPILGICLGMQAMANNSFEGGEHQGLGWFDADVVRLKPDDSSLRVPQLGWNNITYLKDNPFFKGLPDNPDLYFVHSFFMQCHHSEDVVATCEYGGTVTAAIQKENIFATQFHPEKSQDFGLSILGNFLKW